MIIINDNRPYAIYYRTNRHARWRYSVYAGRYETPEEAVKQLIERLNGMRAEYEVQTLSGEIIKTGFVN